MPVTRIFIGDSHLERWLWYDELPALLPHDVFIAAVGGDKIKNVMYRLKGDGATTGLLEALKPRVSEIKSVVLMAGGNNNIHAQKRTVKPELVDTVVAEMMELVAFVRATLPDSVTVTVWAIPCDRENTSGVAAYNGRLEKACRDFGVPFDRRLYDATITQDPDKTFEDDVHLSVSGYKTCMYALVHSDN
jgi:lysophospholipase L1-like esterase